VSQNARTIARALQLNEELVEAIALGHDLGHTPFGHAGERALNEICPYGFEHNEQSVRTVELLEKDGEGLNLTWEVRDGILNHQTSSMPSTLEGKIVRFSDKIAYTYHDMDDAVRAGILKERDVPREVGEIVGYSPRERLNNFIHDIVTQSLGTDDVRMSEDVELAMRELRHFMFDHVYNNPIAKQEDDKAVSLVKTLYEHYMEHTDELPKFFVELGLRGEPREKVVCDYISSMTDRFAINLYDELYVPKFWMG
jgi:dGTPase